MMYFTSIAAFALVLAGTIVRAQDVSLQPVRLSPGLFSLRGKDVVSGTEYVRLFLTANPSSPTSVSEPSPQNSPTFVIECTQLNGKRSLYLYLNFGGVDDIAFASPFRSTVGSQFPPRNPSITLTMTFEGYIHSKPFKRSWEQLPNGGFKYRNPGSTSFNLDDPRYFLQYLNSLPRLHMVSPKPVSSKPADLFFDTSKLLQETTRNSLCQP